MFKAYVDCQLPFGKGKALTGGSGQLTNWLVGGWSVSAILNYFIGTPLGFGGSSPIGAWNGAGNRANVAATDLGSSGFDKAAFQIANVNLPSNTCLNKALFSDHAPLTLGTSPYRYTQIRNFGMSSEDMDLQSNHTLKDRYHFKLPAEFLNAFNRRELVWVAGVFGNRQIQAGSTFDF